MPRFTDAKSSPATYQGRFPRRPHTTTSWGHQIFTHFHYDADGVWKDWGFRYATRAEAERDGRKLLKRIIDSRPHRYLRVNLETHCAPFESDDPVNAGDGLTRILGKLLPDHFDIVDH